MAVNRGVRGWSNFEVCRRPRCEVLNSGRSARWGFPCNAIFADTARSVLGGVHLDMFLPLHILQSHSDSAGGDTVGLFMTLNTLFTVRRVVLAFDNLQSVAYGLKRPATRLEVLVNFHLKVIY
jgi:hypothetical protein